MTRLTRLSAAAQAHYVVLRSVPEISLIPFDRNIEKLFQIFSDGSRAYSTDISAFAVFTDQIHLLLTPREKSNDGTNWQPCAEVKEVKACSPHVATVGDKVRYLRLHIDKGAADRKSTRLNSSHTDSSRMPSSA